MATNTKNNQKKNLTPRQKAAKKRKRIIIFTIEILVLLIMLVVFYAVNKFDNIQRFELNINEKEIGINENVKDNEVISEYLNIALFGVDAKNDKLGKGSRSDTIMIASINEKTKEVKLVSVYRDTYLNLGNDEYNKINAAYGTGGVQQAVQALNSNLDLNIVDYVTVGYKGLIDTVDALGGIYIDVDSAELEHINNYQISIVETFDEEYIPVKKTGKQLLNGLQATAYCRIRYTAGDDFKRTERQREVLMAILEEAKKPEKINKASNAITSIFGHIATSFDLAEIIELSTDLASYEIVANTGFPFEEYRGTGRLPIKGSCVFPDNLEKNVYELHDFLFENEAYEMSPTLKEYSKIIEKDVSGYITGGSKSTPK